MTPLPVEHEPVYVSWEAVYGETFQRIVTLYEDDAKTKLLDLTKYTLKVVVGSLVLKVGEGLTATAQGVLTITLTPKQAEMEGEQHIYVEVEESATVKKVPLRGDIMFVRP